MPSNKIISEKLKTAWVNAGGSHNDKPPLNLHLYWGKKDVNNHIHIFQEEDSTLSYNIKCYGNGGNSRIKHSVDPYQSMKDFIEELQTNWRQECPNFIDDFESGGTTQQQQEYQPQQQQQHQQYQQYQPQQHQQYQPQQHQQYQPQQHQQHQQYQQYQPQQHQQYQSRQHQSQQHQQHQQHQSQQHQQHQSQQHQQYQQYQQPKQRNQQQSSDMDWEYKYLKYKQKYLELKKMLDKKHFNS